MEKTVLGIVVSLIFFLLPQLHPSVLAAETSMKKAAGKKPHATRKASTAVNKANKPASRKSVAAVSLKGKVKGKGASTKNAKLPTHKASAHAKKPATRKSVSRSAAPIEASKVTSVTKVNFHPPVNAAAAAASALPPTLSVGELAGLHQTRDSLALSSNVVLMLDEATSQVLFEKNADVPVPIASITKLMTALLIVEAGQDMNDMLEVTNDDIDREKNTSSRLRIGSRLSRADMLHIALMSSENRAASALGRNYPGGLPAFVVAMNAKAKLLGMVNSRFVEPTGLSSRNVASAHDLTRLVAATHAHPLLAQFSTNSKFLVDTGRNTLQYVNSNRLIGSADWNIELQKTGYISEAGRCLVMHVKVDERPVVMVFLDSKTGQSRFADATRLRKWLQEKKGTGSTAHMKAMQEEG
jgi:D-alanyl-D-alanine endopeptidase (penicillin-binding protein 7)